LNVSTADLDGQHPVPDRPRLLRELLLLAAVFTGYKLGRMAGNGQAALAFRNAHRIWDFERLVRLPSEVDIQRLLLGSDLLVRAANTYYAAVHFPATAAFLLWMYLRRPGQYRWARNALVQLTAAALVLHLLVPLAPPRMLTGVGLVDTAARYGPSVYGAPQSDTVNNQYAAMPSLHVGWALMIAIGLIATTRGPWRWLWLAHPALVTFTVIGTANHYWLDAIVAGGVLAAVLAGGRLAAWRSQARHTGPTFTGGCR
jgi:hypothetical protein